MNATTLLHPRGLSESQRDPEACARLVYQAMERLLVPGEIHEIRALDVALPGEERRNTLSGFFDNPMSMARAAAALDGYARGIYYTVNPLKPELASRVTNAMDATVQAAGDADVLKRRWILLDFDPKRDPDTNSTDEEMAEAVARAEYVWLRLRERNWAEPIPALSGNGVHLLVPADAPAADGGLVKRILHGLAREFSTAEVTIDRSVSNASRIVRLYGTLACKGPATPDRPHRRSRLMPSKVRP